MAKPLRMHQLKRIIELYQEGRSIRETKRQTGQSRTTIRQYHHRIQASGLSAAQLLALDEESLLALVRVEGIDLALGVIHQQAFCTSKLHYLALHGVLKCFIPPLAGNPNPFLSFHKISHLSIYNQLIFYPSFIPNRHSCYPSSSRLLVKNTNKREKFIKNGLI